MRSRIALLVSILAVLAAVPAVAASAADATVDGQRHCVFNVVGERNDGEFIMGAEKCFAAFTEATLYASGGEVHLPADMGPAEFVSSGIAATTSYTIGIHYDYYNGGGSSITVTGASCSGGYWNTPAWFDNRTSSSYAGCYRLQHYDGYGCTGSSAITYGSGSIHNLTTFNNRTESVKYLP